MALIQPQFNPILLNKVQTALSTVWRQDNPFIADAPTIVNASQIRRAVTKAQTDGDLNLAVGLTELAKALEAGNRNLDVNGDGRLEVFKGFIMPTADDRTELDKFAGVLLNADNSAVTLDPGDFGQGTTTPPTNPLNQLLQQLLGLFGLGGSGSSSGNGQLGLVLILLLFSGLFRGGGQYLNMPPRGY